MAHAWLDSLSEDWVSEPGSNDASFAEPSPAPSPSTKLPKPETPSRIPRLSPGVRKFRNAIDRAAGSSGSGSGSNGASNNASSNASSHILGERSINERLAALSRRTPSKLSQELSSLSSPSGRDCHACRSASVSTTNSVVRTSTIHRKSMSASQSKGKGGETPEWKRRLVYGDLSYGEQPDLFTSAGTGLENMFKPPQPTPGPSRDGPIQHSYQGQRQGQDSQLDITLPSSPPLYRRDPSTVEIHVESDSINQPSQQQPKRAATAMRYRRTDESTADESKESELSLPQEALTAPSAGAEGESRKVSGRSDIGYEDFSPIFLERRQASNGKTTFGPAELSPDDLRVRLETLQQDRSLLGVSANDGSNYGTTRTVEITQDYRRLEGFVNFQRGGRSDEGSFRNHMLSSGLNDSSELNPEESLQASTPKQFPTVRVERWASSEHFPAESPDLPFAPGPSPEKRLAPVLPKSGSPLKLFQPYDTFTNQTLLRRLSQMHGEAGDISFSIAVDSSHLPVDSPPSRLLPAAARSGLEDQHSSYANRFGAGELDGYEFNDGFSHISPDATGMDGDKENRDPDEDSMLPSGQPIFDLTHNSSPSEAAEIVVSRRRKSTTSHPSRRSTRASFPAFFEQLSPPGGRRDASISEIKRPRTSPSKDPTPKRRRTLHKSDISYGTEEPGSGLDSIQLPHQHVQSGLGRFRQDARSSGGQHDEEEPEARQAMRPRTPTPSQRSSVQRQPLVELERSPARSSRHSQVPGGPPAGAAVETHRKPSIKTEDFINEANKIMAMIRNKAGLPSGLASLEESDEEKGQTSPDLDGSYEDSTQEPFSRPPSREGRAPLKRLSAKQEDPALAEQLKKYEEVSDMGDIITSSMRSTGPAQEAMFNSREQESEAWGGDQSRNSVSDDGVVSDPPNIRISRNPNWQELRSASGLSDGMPSHGSADLNTHSTGSSVGSSRASENRKTIVPESVLHLIPDQVGNMILDRDRNIWIKRKGSAESRGSWIQSEISEDDPFADIPDLTVDVTREMQNLLLTGKKDGAPLERVPSAEQASPSRPPRAASVARSALDRSPIGQAPNPSRAEGSAEHDIGVKEGRVKGPRRPTITFSSPVASFIQDVAGDMMSEDSVLDHPIEPRDPPARGRKTVSIQETKRSRSARSRSTSRGPQRHLSVKGRSLVARPVSRIDERDEDSGLDHAQYQGAVSGMELSVLGDFSVANRDESPQRGELTFLVATPTRPARACPIPGMDGAPIISQFVGTFALSPLSEFTMHRAEETLPLEASYVVDNHRLVTGDQSKRVMSMSMRELVDKLAEVEPFEPYWEDMRELDLRDKGLSALHALDEYCGQLESLDVSKNKIRNLGGIPSSVLHLRMTDNQLSSLTAWNHLMNLQYIDVSNNNLTSLTVFKSLIHLRSLRADNNQITSLDGIKFHKGLQILRARGNLIEEVDFTNSTLHQLTDLDLKNNAISRITNLAHLPSLSTLNLESNSLTHFAITPPQPLPTLRHLRLADNNLTTLSVHHLPHLRLLHADRNALVRIAGFSRARRIDSLSLREQRGNVPLDLAHLLARALDVRKLYLSGNLLEEFAPKADLLNLQLLEVANCGIRALPEDVGLSMPNLRVVNLNMNALSGLGGLVGVPRLKRICVAGNRLADPAGVVGVLASFGGLASVDLRDNPLTGGFYAPAGFAGNAKQAVVLRSSGEEGAEGEGMFALGDQDADADRRYCARLDMDTRVRRRVYETMVRKRCGKVRKLDGLVVGGKKSKEDAEKAGDDDDVVWVAMEEKGFVTRRGSQAEVEEEEEPVVERSARWPAEDSFA